MAAEQAHEGASGIPVVTGALSVHKLRQGGTCMPSHTEPAGFTLAYVTVRCSSRDQAT